MKIGVLTSSRADYGVYLPLLNKLKNDSFFELEIIAFGTHMSKFHGYTLQNILDDNFSKVHCISSLLSNDDEQAIATSYGLTALKFADFWNNNQFDFVFCLGDRFEMSAAVQAGIPSRVKFIHLYGGETTLGAIDDIYRHQITLASKIHFTATSDYKRKVENVLGLDKNIYSVGSLSLDGIEHFEPLSKSFFYEKFEILNEDFVLVTFHPETIAVNDNGYFANEMKLALEGILETLSLVVTMPNADTLGSCYREKLLELKVANPDKVVLIENFGKENYFSAMYYSKILIGNTSSGIVEAASFNKYVINVGDRQKGRLQSKNIFNVPFEKATICLAISEALKGDDFKGENVYYKKEPANKIIKILKDFS